MRSKLIVIVLSVLGLGLMTEGARAFKNNFSHKIERPKTPILPSGDDAFPWPWGSECPFPWTEVSGTYVVMSERGGEHDGHYITFGVNKEDGVSLKFLNIVEYDENGDIYAVGTGYSQKDKRIVKGLLESEDYRVKDYTVIVRSYLKEAKRGNRTGSQKNSCKDAETILAVTFCPLRGRKCMETNNYVLEKIYN